MFAAIGAGAGHVGNGIRHVLRHPIIYGGLSLIGLTSVYGDTIADNLRTGAERTGNNTGAIFEYPGQIVGGVGSGLLEGTKKGARRIWNSLPDFSIDSSYPDPKPTSDTDSRSPDNGRVGRNGDKDITFTPEETRDLFDVSDADGNPIDPSLFEDCPDEPVGTCYTVEGPINVTIPDGANRDTVDGDTYNSGTTYDDGDLPGTVVGFDYVTLRPGGTERR